MSARTYAELFVLLVIVAAAVVFSVHERDLRETIAKHEQTISALEGAIAIQNQKVRDFEAAAKLRAAHARAAAAAVLIAGQAEQEKIKTGAPGPKEMNEWLTTIFRK